MTGRPSDNVLEGFVRDTHLLTSNQLTIKYRRARSTISEWRIYARRLGHDVGYGPSPITIRQDDVEFDLPFEENNLEGIEDALLVLGEVSEKVGRIKEPYAIFRFEAQPVMVVFWGDWHVGAGDLDLFLKDRDLIIGTEGLKIIGMGDYKSNLSIASFKSLNMDLVRVGFQDKLLIQRYIPSVAESLLGLLVGCHDLWDLYHDTDFVEELCKVGQAKHLWHQCYLEFIFPEVTYTGVAKHKPRRESSLNTTNAQRAIYENEGNPHFVAVAHKHFADLKIQQRRGGGDTVWVRSGSYLIHDEYGQKLGGYSGEPIFPGIIFLPDREQMLAYRDFKTGLSRLSLLRKLYAQGFDIDYETEYLKGLL